MTEEERAEMMGTLQAHSFAMQIIMVSLLNTLHQKGLVSLDEIHDVRDTAIDKIDDLMGREEQSIQWIYQVARDRIFQIFALSERHSH